MTSLDRSQCLLSRELFDFHFRLSFGEWQPLILDTRIRSIHCNLTLHTVKKAEENYISSWRVYKDHWMELSWKSPQILFFCYKTSTHWYCNIMVVKYDQSMRVRKVLWSFINFFWKDVWTKRILKAVQRVLRLPVNAHIPKRPTLICPK